MNKHIDIKLVDPELQYRLINEYDLMRNYNPFVKRPELFPDEICNIINKFDDKRVSNDEMLNALDVITMYLYQNNLYTIIIDIDERNKALEPTKEMTLEEIEKELGYKVKIVNEKGE